MTDAPQSPDRRSLIGLGLGVAAGLAATPVLAQEGLGPDGRMPEVTWRLASGFPRSLDLLYGGAETFAQTVSALTGGRFTITVSAPGEVVAGLQALDAIKAGTIEACHTSMDYFAATDPSFALMTAVPFGLNAREQNAFWTVGGGAELFDDLLRDHGILALPAGNTGAQMGGFYRREVRSVADFTGLKIRIGGLAGRVLQKLGAITQATPRGDLYSALESTLIDAAAWVSPYDDAKITDEGKPSLAKVAPYYYYPGWWKGGSMVHVAFDRAKYDLLPKSYKAALTTAAALANADVLARYDAANPAALRKLVVAGAQFKPFPQDVLEQAYKATTDLNRELSDANPRYKRILDAMMAFRSDEYLWWQVSEYTFDNFQIRQRAKG